MSYYYRKERASLPLIRNATLCNEVKEGAGKEKVLPENKEPFKWRK